jgi:hypothetical protein
MRRRNAERKGERGEREGGRESERERGRGKLMKEKQRGSG